MHDVTLGTKAKKVAATWDELSPAQLLRLMPITYRDYARPTQQRIEVLLVLLGISLAYLLQLTAVQLVEVDWLVGFVLDEPYRLTRQLLPRVRASWTRRWLYGPVAGLGNLRFLEFVFADSFYVAYCQTQDAAWLHKLLAVLYRPGRPWGGVAAGDRRREFNENLLECNLARVRRLPLPVQLAGLTFYRGCRQAWQERFPLVFTPDHESQSAGHRDGWSYVLREVAGGPFGDYEATGRQHASQVLAKMQDDLARAAELKAQQPTA